jgi:hypothetical protein
MTNRIVIVDWGYEIEMLYRLYFASTLNSELGWKSQILRFTQDDVRTFGSRSENAAHSQFRGNTARHALHSSRA